MAEHAPWLALAAPTPAIRAALDQRTDCPTGAPVPAHDQALAPTDREAETLIRGSGATPASRHWVATRTMSTNVARMLAQSGALLPETVTMLRAELERSPDLPLFAALLAHADVEASAGLDFPPARGDIGDIGGFAIAVAGSLGRWLNSDDATMAAAGRMARRGHISLLGPLINAVATSALPADDFLAEVASAGHDRVATVAHAADKLCYDVAGLGWVKDHAPWLLATASGTRCDITLASPAAWHHLATDPALAPVLAGVLERMNFAAASPETAYALATHPDDAVRSRALRAGFVRAHASPAQLEDLAGAITSADAVRVVAGDLLATRPDLSARTLGLLFAVLTDSEVGAYLATLTDPDAARVAAAALLAAEPLRRWSALSASMTGAEPVSDARWALLRASLGALGNVLSPRSCYLRSPMGESVTARVRDELVAAWAADPRAWVAAGALVEAGTVTSLDELIAAVAALVAEPGLA